MRFLVFDSNVVFAKRVAELLRQYVKGVDVELAHNTAVLSHRIDERTYDLVIADVDTALDIDQAQSVLGKAAERMPIILWSAVRGPVGQTQIIQKCNATQILQKAFNKEDLQHVLAEAVGSARE